MKSYVDFLATKAQLGEMSGFDPISIPDYLFDFQKHLVDWSIRKGRSAIFADCGLGKTPMQLVWADNVAKKTNGVVMIATPLAVGAQVLREAEKFRIDVSRSNDGKIPTGAKIVVTNYEKLHLFDSSEFIGLVCDESSILKNFKGVRRQTVTDFSRKLPYRLLCTATAAPNDYIELGTSSESLGELGHMDMLARFFKNEQNTCDVNSKYGQRGGEKWRFKHHAEGPFWRWVCSWARAVRRPSDLGFSDDRFKLPPLVDREHIVKVTTPRDGWLFDLPAVGMKEEREERRRSIVERCDKVAELVEGHDQSLIWCHLNPEGDRLEKTIKDSRQVEGSQSDEEKEELLLAFAAGQLKRLITKPKIGAFGLNFQSCAHVVFFPSHSYEQKYQGVRRCWRFGQTRQVICDTVATEGESGIMANLQRKSEQADRMFAALVENMNNALGVSRVRQYQGKMEVPSWV